MNRKKRVLIVEDEDPIRAGLMDVLVFHGYEVDGEADGVRGLERAKSGDYDLVVLDVMLPSVDGFTICNELRKHSRRVAIIMLTARTSDDDIITGLTLGADDYVAKPFSVRQLVLRIEAVLRRVCGEDEGERELAVGNLRIDTRNLSGVREGEEVLFTRREVEILRYLKRHADRPVSREELLEDVWGYKRGNEIETRTVDIHLAKLRKKLETDPKRPTLLVTVRGEGYRLVCG